MPTKKYQEFIPHAVLQDYVKRFWILEKEYTAEDNNEEIIPDACVELILNFGTPYERISGSTRYQLPNVCLIGLQKKPLILQANGVVKLVAVRFFAWGALSFLEDEGQLGGTTKLNLDDEWLAAISKSAAKAHARRY